MLKQERLKELLHYDPETGIFTWMARTANTIHVGQMAGTTKPDGYVVIQIFGNLYRAHRLAWLYMHGKWPSQHIDHRDGNTSNNKWSNLRDESRNINLQNQRKAHTTNRTGFLGVTPHKNLFQARITTNGNQIYLGLYRTPELAHAAYLDAKRELHAGNTL